MSPALPGRAARRPWSRAIGAVAGQVTLAAGSFVLQLLAARSLGAEGFGVFALLFGTVVMATAVSTGLVGDSLTVLDRDDPVLRSALVRTGSVVVGTAGGLGVTAAVTIGGLSPGTGVAFGAALVTFMAADLARRLLMAGLRFWDLVAADGLGFVAAMATLVLASRTDRLTLVDFLMALAVGQAAACLTVVGCLPPHERRWVPYRRGGVRAVVAFGGWRALQQFVRPTMLNAVRWLVLVAVGAAAVGELEAARLVVAPAMLLVQGIGSYLFASYAADRSGPLGPLLRRADRAAAVMLGGAAVLAGAATIARPLAAPLLGRGYDVSVVALLGWGVYAASCAAVLPYGSLAAVRGRQAAVLGLRLADAALGLGAVATALLALGAPPAASPWLLAIGSFAGGALCRRLLLVPLAGDSAAPGRSVVGVPAAATGSGRA